MLQLSRFGCSWCISKSKVPISVFPLQHIALGQRDLRGNGSAGGTRYNLELSLLPS